MEGVVMAPARSGVEAQPTPRLWLVGEIERQSLVDPYLREIAWLNCQAEDLGEELGRRHLVLRRYDGVIQLHCHRTPLYWLSARCRTPPPTPTVSPAFAEAPSPDPQLREELLHELPRLRVDEAGVGVEALGRVRDHDLGSVQWVH